MNDTNIIYKSLMWVVFFVLLKSASPAGHLERLSTRMHFKRSNSELVQKEISRGSQSLLFDVCSLSVCLVQDPVDLKHEARCLKSNPPLGSSSSPPTSRRWWWAPSGSE